MTDPNTTLLDLLRAGCDVIWPDELRLYVDRYKLIVIADGSLSFPAKRYPTTKVGLENALREIDLIRQDRELERMEADLDD